MPVRRVLPAQQKHLRQRQQTARQGMLHMRPLPITVNCRGRQTLRSCLHYRHRQRTLTHKSSLQIVMKAQHTKHLLHRAASRLQHLQRIYQHRQNWLLEARMQMRGRSRNSRKQQHMNPCAQMTAGRQVTMQQALKAIRMGMVQRAAGASRQSSMT